MDAVALDDGTIVGAGEGAILLCAPGEKPRLLIALHAHGPMVLRDRTLVSIESGDDTFRCITFAHSGSHFLITSLGTYHVSPNWLGHAAPSTLLTRRSPSTRPKMARAPGTTRRRPSNFTERVDGYKLRYKAA